MLSGQVTAIEARAKAEVEYERFRSTQDAAFESEFDRFVKDAAQLSRPDGDAPDAG